MSVVLPNTPVGLLALALEALDDVALSVFRDRYAESSTVFCGTAVDLGDMLPSVAASRVLPPIDASRDLKEVPCFDVRTALDGRDRLYSKRRDSSELILVCCFGRGIQALKDLTMVASRLVIMRVNADT
ncbi:hypothetical protein BASA81_009442 [Batrachochytrium salamandrivorans]|nr:hypothetical protein BASA81_009442 [Batrachochytrium salamandrivorans]